MKEYIKPETPKKRPVTPPKKIEKAANKIQKKIEEMPPITSMKVEGDDSEPMPTNPLVMPELVGGDSSAINTPVIEKKETSK